MRKLTKSMWLRRVGPLSLAGALVFPLAMSGAEADAPAACPQGVYESNQAAWKSFFDGVEKQRREAMQLAGEGKFNEAIVNLEKLLATFADRGGSLAESKREEIHGNIVRIKRAWSSEVMREAQKLAAEKKYGEAIVKAELALALTPNRDYIANFIVECNKCLSAADFAAETSVATVTPKLDDIQTKIDAGLREAKVFFRNGRYESACERLEGVLLVDPFNVEAIDLLALSYDRLYQIGVDRSRADLDLHNARSVWEWTEPLNVKVDSTTDSNATVRDAANTDLYNRLRSIVFPKVPLGNSTMTSIIAYLNDKSRVYDPNQVGVTIIDNLSPQQKKLEISFDQGKMPLLDIIRYLSMASGIPYSFRGDKVIFGDVNNMVTQSFQVRGSIIAEIIESQISIPTDSGMSGPEEGGVGDGAPASLGRGGDNGLITPDLNDSSVALPGMLGDDLAGSDMTVSQSSGASAADMSAALKSYFSARWIPFEDGADIIYSPRGQRLMVRNTPENLQRMETLLQQLDVLEQPMVLVEVKMIELTDTNLNELGFEWMFSAGPANGENDWSIGTTDPTRHGLNGNMFRVLNDLKILPNFGEKIFGSDMRVDLSLSINAVAQNRRAEVLASPRILTISGSQTPAKIQMTEATYFVTEWEQPDIETDGFNISMDSTEPEWDDDAYDLGVTFSVQPTVLADNYTIQLNNINPVFLSHINDYNYIVTYEVGTVDPQGNMVPVRSQTFDLRMPEIAHREINTSITLYDGETVLIGGMADNESTAREDKWPILGDIPLLGRLFQDQQTNVTNRTMLIFVTARLVDSTGRPLRDARERGLMDFNR